VQLRKGGYLCLRRISLIIKARSDGRQHALVGKLQSGVHGVLANDQSVLVGHYHSAEADVRLVTLLQPLCISLNILFSQRVFLVQPQVHLSD
jgi:hypothetical protein